MNKSFVFYSPLDSDKIIKKFNLTKIISNERTSIYQNDKMRFSFDKKVLRILVFNDNKDITNTLYNYFYGEQYEKCK